MKILLIGCGKTGGAIAKNLANLSYVNEIYLLSKFFKGAKKLEKSLGNKKVRAIATLDDVEDVDYAIIALSQIPKKEREKSFRMAKTTHEVRQNELKFNLSGIKNIGNLLKSHSKKIKYIIVTNPSEEITNYLQHVLGHKNVFGFGTELDAKRYSKILGKEIYCLGPHGRAFPLIDSNSMKDYDRLLIESDRTILKHLRDKGIQHELVALSFQDFFEKLNSKKNVVHICSYLNEPFLGVQDIAISLPFEVEEGQVVKPAKIRVNELEKERFRQLAKELRVSVDKLTKDY